jgi:Cu/Ag efflux pump CusA
VQKLVNIELDLVFVDKEGKIYPLTEVNSIELAKGLEKITKETAKRLLLQKQQR